MVNFLGIYLEPLSYALYLLVMTFLYRRNPSGRKAVLLVFYVIATLLTVYANYLLTFPKNDPRSYNEWVYNLLFLLTCLFLSYFFVRTLVKPGRKKSMMAMAALVTAVFSFYFIKDLSADTLPSFYSYAIASSHLAIVVGCLFYFHQLLTIQQERTLFLNTNFWLVAGFFLNYSGNFFIVLSFHYLSTIAGPDPTQQQRDLFTILWSAQNLLLFGSALLTLIFSLWINYRKESRSPSLPRFFS